MRNSYHENVGCEDGNDKKNESHGLVPIWNRFLILGVIQFYYLSTPVHFADIERSTPMGWKPVFCHGKIWKCKKYKGDKWKIVVFRITVRLKQLRISITQSRIQCLNRIVNWLEGVGNFKCILNRITTFGNTIWESFLNLFDSCGWFFVRFAFICWLYGLKNIISCGPFDMNHMIRLNSEKLNFSLLKFFVAQIGYSIH